MADEDRGSNSSRPRARRPPESEENAISASRRPRKSAKPAPTASGPAETTAPAETAASADKRSDSDPWTVPASVLNRFVQEGNRFYFPDGHEAFQDRGRRLTTTSENTQVVHGLIEIARSRGWTEVSVAGTERFRGEAWRQARLAGLSVRGYRPSDEERVQLIRALARNREGTAEANESRTPDPTPPSESRTAPESSPQRIQGKLLEHGKDFYRHDPNEQRSYFVRLQTPEGKREIWGKDIERAVTQSLSQPKVGDEVVLHRTGRDPVTVQRQEKDEQGELREKEVGAFRNRWGFETRELLDQRAVVADAVRDESIRPQEGVRRHPELAGTYLNLRAAELASRVLLHQEDRQRFVRQVRAVLAREIEQGEPLQARYVRRFNVSHSLSRQGAHCVSADACSPSLPEHMRHRVK
jgi:Large polyvalent protein-associated domain 7